MCRHFRRQPDRCQVLGGTRPHLAGFAVYELQVGLTALATIRWRARPFGPTHLSISATDRGIRVAGSRGHEGFIYHPVRGPENLLISGLCVCVRMRTQVIADEHGIDPTGVEQQQAHSPEL